MVRVLNAQSGEFVDVDAIQDSTTVDELKRLVAAKIGGGVDVATLLLYFRGELLADGIATAQQIGLLQEQTARGSDAYSLVTLSGPGVATAAPDKRYAVLLQPSPLFRAFMHEQFHKLELPPLPAGMTEGATGSPATAAAAAPAVEAPSAAPSAPPAKPAAAAAKPAAAAAAAGGGGGGTGGKSAPAEPPAAAAPAPTPGPETVPTEDPRQMRMRGVVVEAEPGHTVAQFKRAIKAITKLRRDRMDLRLEGRRLDDKTTLDKSGLQPRLLVSCLVLPPAPTAPAPESDDEALAAAEQAAAGGKPGAKQPPPKKK